MPLRRVSPKELKLEQELGAAHYRCTVLYAMVAVLFVGCAAIAIVATSQTFCP